MAAGGYPGSYRKGDVISGLDAPQEAGRQGVSCRYPQQDGQVVTSGGRVLCVCALGEGCRGRTAARLRSGAGNYPGRMPITDAISVTARWPARPPRRIPGSIDSLPADLRERIPFSAIDPMLAPDSVPAAPPGAVLPPSGRVLSSQPASAGHNRYYWSPTGAQPLAAIRSSTGSRSCSDSSGWLSM